MLTEIWSTRMLINNNNDRIVLKAKTVWIPIEIPKKNWKDKEQWVKKTNISMVMTWEVLKCLIHYFMWRVPHICFNLNARNPYFGIKIKWRSLIKFYLMDYFVVITYLNLLEHKNLCKCLVHPCKVSPLHWHHRLLL